jgi:hypothetical protein
MVIVQQGFESYGGWEWDVSLLVRRAPYCGTNISLVHGPASFGQNPFVRKFIWPKAHLAETHLAEKWPKILQKFIEQNLNITLLPK